MVVVVVVVEFITGCGITTFAVTYVIRIFWKLLVSICRGVWSVYDVCRVITVA